MIAYRLLVQEFPIAGAEWGAKAPRFVISADGTYKLYTDVHIYTYTVYTAVQKTGLAFPD